MNWKWGCWNVLGPRSSSILDTDWYWECEGKSPWAGLGPGPCRPWAPLWGSGTREGNTRALAAEESRWKMHVCATLLESLWIAKGELGTTFPVWVKVKLRKHPHIRLGRPERRGGILLRRPLQAGIRARMSLKQHPMSVLITPNLGCQWKPPRGS